MANRLRWLLKNETAELETIAEWEHFLDRIQDRPVSLIVLAWPRLQQTEIERLRELNQVSLAPALVIGQDVGPEARTLALQAGAAEYLAEPFEPQHLSQKLQLAARLTGNPPVAGRLLQIRVGLDLDFIQGALVADGQRLIPLTPTEFLILRLLLAHRGQIVRQAELLAVTGRDEKSRDSLYVQIRSLRKKIEVDPDRPTLLHKRYNRGYQLDWT